MISSDEREAKHNSQKIFPQDPSCWFFTARTDSVCLIGQLSRRIRASLSVRSYNLLPVFDHILQITCNCAGGADGYRASNSRQLFGQRLLHSDFKENDPASDSTRASGEAPYSIGRSYQPRQKINAIILFLFFPSLYFYIPISMPLFSYTSRLRFTARNAIRCLRRFVNHARHAYLNILSFPRNAQFRRTKREVYNSHEYNNRFSFRKSSLYFYYYLKY